MKGQPAISSVYRFGQSAHDTDPMAEWGRIERLRRQAWVNHGMIAIRASDIPEPLRAQMIEWANENLGRRNNG